jgi:cell wall assembly regulator SMI1
VIQFERSNGPVTVDVIAALEKQLGARLPSDYSSFLRQDNGGRPLEYAVTVAGWGDTVINSFFGAGCPGRQALDFQARRMSSMLPEAVMPIGDDPGGNYFCICLRPPDAGAVFLWDHEQAALFRIAQSFSSFLFGVRPC